MRIIYSILLLTFISGHLFAQRSETVQTNDSTFSVIKQLKEVVITAEKRELSISEIPVALSVISGKNLLNENNPDLRNLSGIVPEFLHAGRRLETINTALCSRNWNGIRDPTRRFVRGWCPDL